MYVYTYIVLLFNADTRESSLFIIIIHIVIRIINSLSFIMQALTLGLWMQWPGGPVDLKTYCKNLLAPQKLTGPFPKTKLVR